MEGHYGILERTILYGRNGTGLSLLVGDFQRTFTAGPIKEGLTENPHHSTSLSKKAALSQLTIFPNNSHLPFWEERGAFTRRVGRFLAHV